MMRRGMLGRFAADATSTSKQLTRSYQGFARVTFRHSPSRNSLRTAPIYSLGRNVSSGIRTYATANADAAVNATKTASTAVKKARKSASPKKTTKGKTTAATAKKSKKSTKAKRASTTRKAVKKKAAPKKPKKKVLTEKQKATAVTRKQKDKIKRLQEEALSHDEPVAGAQSAWNLIISELAGSRAQSLVAVTKEAISRYRNLTPAELEHYNHLLNESKAAHAAAYKAWVHRYTPEQIRRANAARQLLRRIMRQENRLHKARSRGLRPIKDERQPKRPIPAFLLFVVERRESGDFKNIAFGDTSQLIVKEWKSFSEAEKKKYRDLQASDIARYHREYRAAYGHDPEPTKSKSAAAA